MSIKNWVLSKVNKGNALRISEDFNLPFFLSTLLDIRKYSDEKIETEILYDEYEIQDPLLFSDMANAERLLFQGNWRYDEHSDGPSNLSFAHSCIHQICHLKHDSQHP